MNVVQSGLQAITTRYLGPTNHRGARVKATCQAGSITIPWDHAWNADKNHAMACAALQAKLGWREKRIGGALPDGRGYAFVVALGE